MSQLKVSFASFQELTRLSLDQIKQINDAASRGDITYEQASRLVDGIVDKFSEASKSLVDNQEIKNALIIASKDPNSNIHVRSVNEEVEIQRSGSFSSNSLALYTPLSKPTEPQESNSTDWNAIKKSIINLAIQEESKWTKEDGNKYIETDSKMRSNLEDYWIATGFAESSAEFIRNRTPWSAAFICWCVRNAGVPQDSGFDFSALHLDYIVGALRNRLRGDLSKRFWLFNIGELIPRPGDFVCNNRSGSTWTYSYLFERYWGKDGNRSDIPVIPAEGHCEIVTKINVDSITLIGGNINNSVSYNRLSINNQGFINDLAVPNGGKRVAIIRIMNDQDII